MATSELIVNDRLATALRKRYKSWQSGDIISCENTGTLVGFTGKRPDLIVRDNPMAPVSIETEFLPAATVENDAIARLGKIYKPTGGTIHSSIAVRYPAKYRNLSGTAIDQALEADQAIEYCLISGEEAASAKRWPSAGYLKGTVTDLAFVVASARVSPIAVERGATILENGAKVLAAMLETASEKNVRLGLAMADALKQESTTQTYTMAATILVNAFVFQETIAGTSIDLTSIPNLADLGADGDLPTKREVTAAWNAILKINYWPIFGVAKKLLAAVPAAVWKEFIEACLAIADKLNALNLGKNPDLIGTIFQRLISDRRFLATFYTAPSSAALMSRLMLRPHTKGGLDWSDIDSIKKLKIADFACGTGTLLCTLYSDVRNAVENAGGDSSSIHRWMVENALFGCDVIPSATHITASQLSSAFPSIQYTDTKILTMPFGRVADGGVSLGSLDLLDTQGAMSVISTHAGGVGSQSEMEVDAWAALGGTAVSDQSFDLIAMNPPFTRLTGGGGKTDKVSRPLFAAFGTTEDDQKAMGKKATKLFHGSAYHGNAGAASAFAEIGHRKLRDGGRIGLILPLAAMAGISWEDCRALWRKFYRDIITISIASPSPGASAFSADTGVAECMIIGTRSKKPGKTMVSVSLYRRPVSTLEGVEIARRVEAMIASGKIRGIADGPLGGTPIFMGDEKVGEAVVTPIGTGPWPVSRIHDHALAQVAYQLIEKKEVMLPGAAIAIAGAGPFCKLGDLGEEGPYDMDVSSGTISGGAPRGPFELVATMTPASVTFPVHNAHHEERERFLEIPADCEGRLRQVTGAAAQALLTKRRDAIVATRTKLHFARDVRFNANALIACVTTREAIGGRAWPSFLITERKYEKALVLWFNSSLGILTFWWLATKAQDGRGSVTKSRLRDLTCFDPRSLSDAELVDVDTFFDDFKTKPLLDIHECAVDPHREELDRFVALHFLKAGTNISQVENGLQLVRAKLVVEPSINGGRT